MSAAASPDAVRCELRGIHKRFAGVHALEGVDLELRGGEVLALVGENGAGKSTLMRVLAGVHRPDEGELVLDGRPVRVDSPRAATRLGIALIHQELLLCENLTAAANVFLGRERTRGAWLDEDAMRARADELLAGLGARFDGGTPVHRLSTGERQLVEIARALSTDARVILFDEPTASLTARETEELFRVARDLVARGVAVVWISHRLFEVERLADRVEVLRDGRNAGAFRRGAYTREDLVHAMVGRDLDGGRRATHAPGATRLSVRGLVTAAHPAHALDLELRAGERVALAGLVGAGRSEVLRALFGIDRPLAGEVRVDGRPLRPGVPRAAMEAGLALVPEDRAEAGLFLEWSVGENLSVASLEALAGPPGRPARGALAAVRGEREAALVARGLADLGVRCAGPDQAVGDLSGGNQQKVVVGRWLARGPGVLLLDEPTRGVDVGARDEIYRLLERLGAEGLAILFASSELEEVLHLADRVLVLHEGRLAGELPASEASEERIMDLATGGAAVPGRDPGRGAER